jgi:hypothetical protein
MQVWIVFIEAYDLTAVSRKGHHSFPADGDTTNNRSSSVKTPESDAPRKCNRICILEVDWRRMNCAGSHRLVRDMIMSKHNSGFRVMTEVDHKDVTVTIRQDR